ncbi:hypothetical protein ABT352_14745 [Streptosporangium sp. NPDC000563]|uniref:hypothetical protein n=1 Tax=Streptosporangium sp. NPDC000563 TaxID=3154366 RepID=UPI00331E705D
MGALFGPGLYAVAVFVLGLGQIVLVFAALFGMAVLYAVAQMTPRGSPMTMTKRGRVLWAGAVLALGVMNWIVGVSTLSKMGLVVGATPLWWSLLSAVPFALAAALCVGGWTSIVSIILTMALILTGCS